MSVKIDQIGKHFFKWAWQGFVPAHKAHPRSLCAFYHCRLARDTDGGRYCKPHAKQYDREALELDPSKKVIPFVRPSES